MCGENTLLQTLESSSPLHQYHISWDVFPISLNLTSLWGPLDTCASLNENGSAGSYA